MRSVGATLPIIIHSSHIAMLIPTILSCWTQQKTSTATSWRLLTSIWHSTSSRLLTQWNQIPIKTKKTLRFSRRNSVLKTRSSSMHGYARKNTSSKLLLVEVKASSSPLLVKNITQMPVSLQTHYLHVWKITACLSIAKHITNKAGSGTILISRMTEKLMQSTWNTLKI